MREQANTDEPEYDKVTQASMNGLYVKAQELDRGHNDHAAPTTLPPGSTSADATAHTSDASAHASDGEAHASDADTHASGASAHVPDDVTGASDATAPASDGDTHASDASTHAS